MKRNLVLCMLILLPCYLSAQPWFSKSIDVENQNNNGWQILVEDDELILVSPNNCDTIGNQVCTFLAKTDWEGNLNSYAIIDGHKMASTKESFLKTSDSIYHAFTHPSPFEENNVQILELNSSFEVVQEWEFGAEQENERPYYWVEHEDGFLTSSISYENEEYISWFTFLDKDMEIVHQAMFPEWESEYGLMVDDGLLSTQDGNFVSTGRLVTTTPDYKTITKFTNEMEVLWHTRFEIDPFSLGDDLNVVELNNGNLAVNWEQRNTTNPYNDSLSPMNLKMVGIDGTSGDTIWSHVMWMPRPTYPNVYKLNRANNGDIIGMGQIYLPPGPEEWLEEADGAGFIFRMSPGGELKWKRYILDTKSPLADIALFLNSSELPNGDLIFTGLYQDTFPNHDPYINNPNIWLVRTDSMGCLTPGCGDLQIVTDSTVLTSSHEAQLPPKGAFHARVFPNPTTNHWTLEWNYPDKARLQITDLQGRLLREQEVQPGQQKISAQGLPPGVYFLQIRSEAASGSVKVIKQR